MDLLKEQTFTLSAPLEYSSKGDTLQATFVTLIPPTSKLMKQCSAIKQLFYRAAHFVQKNNVNKNSEEKDQDESKNDDEESDDNEGLYDVFYLSDIDIEDVILAFRKLYKAGGILIDGEVKVTDPLIDKISLDDFEKISSIYLGNFIAASMLSQKLKKS